MNNFYFLNLQEQPEGEHEIHKKGCRFFPEQAEYLGQFVSDDDALSVARYRHPYWNINGCRTCCPKVDTD